MHLRDILCGALEAELRGEKKARPEGWDVIWGAFQRLSLTRSYGPTGPVPITFTEVDAYCRLMRMPLEPRHVDLLMEMDRVWIGHFYSGRGANGGKPGADISAAAFDAFLG